MNLGPQHVNGGSGARLCRRLAACCVAGVLAASPAGLSGCGPADASASSRSASQSSDPFSGNWVLERDRPGLATIELHLARDGSGRYRARSRATSINTDHDVTWTRRSADRITVHKCVGGQASSVAMLTLRLRSVSELEWLDSSGGRAGSRFIKR